MDLDQYVDIKVDGFLQPSELRETATASNILGGQGLG
jgi:hypothetical protein